MFKSPRRPNGINWKKVGETTSRGLHRAGRATASAARWVAPRAKKAAKAVARGGGSALRWTGGKVEGWGRRSNPPPSVYILGFDKEGRTLGGEYGPPKPEAIAVAVGILKSHSEIHHIELREGTDKNGPLIVRFVKKGKTWIEEGPARPLSVIAREIRADWKKPYFGAVPYIEALSQLNSIRDSYGQDDARGIVSYFLVNASAWRGETAKRVKAELKAMLGRKNPRAAARRQAYTAAPRSSGGMSDGIHLQINIPQKKYTLVVVKGGMITFERSYGSHAALQSAANMMSLKAQGRAKNPPSTTPTFKVGQVVRYTSEFLHNTGQFTGAPIDGMVRKPKDAPPGDEYTFVQWNDRNKAVWVNSHNLELHPSAYQNKPGYGRRANGRSWKKV